MLHNELYTGKVIWNRREWVKNPDTGLRTYRERPQSQWVVHHMPELELVDPDTWARCHARLCRTHGGQRGPRRYLLSGLLECGICASKFVIYGGKGHRYVCGSYHGGGAHACSNTITVPRDLAEELILKPVIKDMLAPAAIKEMADYMRRELRRTIQPVTTPDVDRLDAEIAELTRLLKAGILSPARADVAINAAETEKAAALRDARRRLCGTSAYTTDELVEAYIAEAQRLREAIQGPNVVVGREALKDVVGSIVLKPQGKWLEAHFQRGEVLLATGSGVDRVVAGPRFGRIYPPILLKRSA